MHRKKDLQKVSASHSHAKNASNTENGMHCEQNFLN